MGGRRPARQAADRARRLEAVHARHLHVHQHQWVDALARHLDGRTAVDRDVYGQAGALQRLDRDFAVDRVVLCQQQPGATVPPAQFGHGLLAGEGGRAGAGLHAATQVRGEPEGAAPARQAFGTGLVPHQFRQPPGDGQPEAGAAVVVCRRGVGLLEGFEQHGHLFGRDAHARVLHLEAHQQAAALVIQQPGTEPDGAAVGEFTALLA